MNRRPKGPGLVFVMVVVAAALAAAPASADAAEFKMGHTDQDLTGIHEGTEEFTFDYGTVKCSIGEYVGALSSATKEIPVIALNPSYSECTLGAMAVEFAAEACYWQFDVGVVEGGKFEGELSVGCPNGKEEFVFVVKQGAEVRCTIRIPRQQGWKTVTYTNKEDGAKVKDLTVDVSLTSLVYTQTPGVGLTKCPNASKANGKWVGSPTIRAYDEEGQPSDLSVG